MSSSHERAVKGYLKPSMHSFIKKYADTYEMSESAAINQAAKALYDTIPKDIRDRILRTPSKNSY